MRASGPAIVVKPTVSAGSKDTAMLDGDDPRALSLAEKILADGKAVMIQPANANPNANPRGWSRRLVT